MKIFLFIFTNLFFINLGQSQSHINFILEFNDNLITEASLSTFVLSYSKNQKMDSLLLGATLGELQMSTDDFFLLQNLPDSTLFHVSFKIGEFNLAPGRTYSFSLEKRFFFQRYLYIRFYDGHSKSGKCGWEYDSPINMKRLPVHVKKILWWYRIDKKCSCSIQDNH